MTRSREDTTRDAQLGGFLPDFCGVRMVFAVVVVAQLLAFILILGSPEQIHAQWDTVGIVSLFVQWVALTSAAALCVSRRWLARLSNSAAAVCSYMLVLAVTLLLSEVAFRLGRIHDVFFAPGWHLRFLLHNLGVSAIVAAVALRFFYLQHQQHLHLQARIEALQARIRPHFLFNSLNTVAALIRSRPREAEAAIEDLADLFRFNLSDAGRTVTLAEELAIAERYLHMEQLRLGPRLRVQWQLDEIPRDVRLPPLTLQPLLENAIYHGIEPLPEGGVITVRGSVGEDAVRLVLENPLASGGDPARNAGQGMALANIRERLHFAFGRRARVELLKEGGVCRVELCLPNGGTP